MSCASGQNAAADVVGWIVADNADPATPGRLVAAARHRFGRLDGALISMDGSPPGTVATTTDDAWRSAFESVFLGAVQLARVLAAGLGDTGDGGPVGGSLTGADGSIVFVLASSVRVPLAELAISNGLFPALAGVAKMLACELGPPGIRVNGILPVRIATDRAVSSMPCAAIRMRCGPGCLGTSRCAGTGNPRSSAGRPRSCCLPPRPTSRAR
jgi:3-oxoacyl-[acyl-carrier protein] reductase